MMNFLLTNYITLYSLSIWFRNGRIIKDHPITENSAANYDGIASVLIPYFKQHNLYIGDQPIIRILTVIKNDTVPEPTEGFHKNSRRLIPLVPAYLGQDLFAKDMILLWVIAL